MKDWRKILITHANIQISFLKPLLTKYKKEHLETQKQIIRQVNNKINFRIKYWENYIKNINFFSFEEMQMEITNYTKYIKNIYGV